jgi:acyl-coenzyme A thioesterase PaaI-like protein
MKLLTRPTISSAWAKATKLPLGNRVFSRLIGRMAPYTGTIGAVVLELSDGHSVVELQDKPTVRNHLKSVHAVALINLGEVATGLAVLHAIDGRGRGIVTELRMEYLKKARGTITATCDAEIPVVPGKHDLQVEGELRDRDGQLVAKAYATWRIDLE